jgi:2-oxoglutarate decarboxylase
MPAPASQRREERENGGSAYLGAFGANSWLVDDMFERYLADPGSVSESWREFFADYRRLRPGNGVGAERPAGAEAAVEVAPVEAASVPAVAASNGVAAPEATAQGAPAPAAQAVPEGRSADGARTAEPPARATERSVASANGASPEVTATALRGAQARIVVNMAASLQVPTATSVREVPAKLLEVNRRILNDHLARELGGKVSFTHLIGYAVVQAARSMPAMNSAFVEDCDGKGTPGVVRHPHVGLGLAVDVERPDGSRTLMVPCVRDADTLDFREFLLAYEDQVRKVRTGKVSPDDFAGVTISLTNPGTLGTTHSVPRLMPGQGTIVGVGALGWPPGFAAADSRSLAGLGVSRVLTLTSTYDHRIIQGAESGLFLARIERLLLGDDGFYDEIFRSMGVPYVPARWHRDENPGIDEHERLLKQTRVDALVNMYRVRGHLIANLDPLEARVPEMHPELDPLYHGLTIWDLDREFLAGGVAGMEKATLDEILHALRDAYCRTVGVEYTHIQDPEQKRWIQEHVEGAPQELSAEEQRWILGRLNAAEAFERFLHTKYVGQKRFGLEGAESAIVILDEVLDQAAKAGLVESVMGMAHRGRLNVLANIVGKSYGEIFKEFEGNLDPDTVQGSGDVKYHKGASGKFVGRSGVEIPISLASNPSHLEAVDPVVEGMVRGKQDQQPDPSAFPVLPILVHGDAAFAGQGVVAETLELSALRGYRTGGTIHVVINNQLGFTTAPEYARSSVYSTDVAKTVQAPILHVNGDDPEACVRVARLAFEFRQTFQKDVVIDMVCYRRYGHNEGDEPSYTQPRMYARIERQRSVRKRYTERLVKRGDITVEEAERALDDFGARLQTALDETRMAAPPKPDRLPSTPRSVALPIVDTGVPVERLSHIASVLHGASEGFHVHPKLARQLESRAKSFAEGWVDWSLGEALAFGSLLLEGRDVRLAGQDTRRGTFSQRHAVLVDYDTEAEYVPLAELAPGNQGRFFVYDSLLSEYAALGFEYGYSVAAPDALVAWEAQFGDFANGGQIIIDQFIAAAHDKWGQSSGLVLLLPHGYEGQGPEHSSARVERFLTLAAGDNMVVANATTAAQYFHLLRLQVHRGVRRPLVLFTPKSMLRSRHSRSSLDEFATGRFREVLDDPGVSDPSGIRRVVLATGKVAFEAMDQRAKLVEAGRPLDSAIVRVEQLHPWPQAALEETLARYGSAEELIWLQEEPENMGAWAYVLGRLPQIAGGRRSGLVARAPSGSPATGSAAMHQLEQADLFERALGVRPV